MRHFLYLMTYYECVEIRDVLTNLRHRSDRKALKKE